MENYKHITAVITAAGKGSRMGLAKNKLLAVAGTKTILEHTVDKFLNFDGVTDIIITAALNDLEIIQNLFKNTNKPLSIVEGGNTRTQSVLNALKAVNSACDIVLIHDGARPFVSDNIIKCCIDDALRYGSAITAVPVTDTIKKADSNFKITSSVDREDLYAVQTPQGFIYKDILAAYLKIDPSQSFTDDSSVYEEYIGQPYICMGETTNIKITYCEDLKYFCITEKIMKNGIGYDSHKFGENRKFILGGEEIAFEKGLIGHSDADALCHAVIDSLFSAAGLADIGTYFPDNDEQYLNANSIELLEKCREILKQKGFEPLNVSAVIVCQKPKLSPYINAMKNNIANALKINADDVGISAKTNEGMDSVGKGEGLFVIANCTITAIF